MNVLMKLTFLLFIIGFSNAETDSVDDDDSGLSDFEIVEQTYAGEFSFLNSANRPDAPYFSTDTDTNIEVVVDPQRFPLIAEKAGNYSFEEVYPDFFYEVALPLLTTDEDKYGNSGYIYVDKVDDLYNGKLGAKAHYGYRDANGENDVLWSYATFDYTGVHGAVAPDYYTGYQIVGTQILCLGLPSSCDEIAEESFDYMWDIADNDPTSMPTEEPTSEPTPEPTSEPTPEPTREPSHHPTTICNSCNGGCMHRGRCKYWSETRCNQRNGVFCDAW